MIRSFPRLPKIRCFPESTNGSCVIVEQLEVSSLGVLDCCSVRVLVPIKGAALPLCREISEGAYYETDFPFFRRQPSIWGLMEDGRILKLTEYNCLEQLRVLCRSAK